jgi:hypothetical protein
MVCALPVAERDTLLKNPWYLTTAWKESEDPVPNLDIDPDGEKGFTYADALCISTRSDIKRVTLALLKKRKQK